MRGLLIYTALAAGCALLVGWIGGVIAPAGAREAVWVGVGIAFVLQLSFVVLFMLAFSKHPLLVHGLGMLGRMLAVGTIALFWLPTAGHPAAPLLFALVSVFFVTTLLEPLFLIRTRPVR